ncbi:GntR family transcriptional regulator [Micromonospora sagamiensis]|uniref:GntR family transcriptional regulator n=1 Tax=Micromonospora sagamiensis TaxID=47875 RepID=A0A562WHJ5_9ACTN|nr:GntR family transcriptional regulator [Micromonospora sagamiensis]TWJ29736.1 GntR family transcriptional regulator [Micromonospora sagamiensis]BCL17236.1 GntR family transcriptional regulator [Micromonospora sagamiensis]
MTSKEPPNYQRVVDDLRSRILSGQLGPGDKLPTEKELQQRWGFSTTIIKHALTLLRSEGLIEGRRGSGNYVRDRTQLVRRAHSRDMRKRLGSTSPFARDSEAAGKQPTWEANSRRIPATPRIAGRLGLQTGDLVMHTTYRYLADGVPIQLADSYEPLSITGGTPIEYPEQGPVIGVVARMDFIGVNIDRYVEEVTSRPAVPEEADALELDRRGGRWVIAIERTYYAGQTAVEFADIVFPGDRYRLIYEVPVDPWSPSADSEKP